jgi:hypothetical protein
LVCVQENFAANDPNVFWMFTVLADEITNFTILSKTIFTLLAKQTKNVE